MQHRAGNPSSLATVEEALAHRWTAAEREPEAQVDVRADVVGGQDRVRERITELVHESQADEVIASTNTFDPAERRRSYERLAAALGLTPRGEDPLPTQGWPSLA